MKRVFPWDPDGRVEGRWRLTRGHTLEYRGDGPRRELMVAGPITRAGPLALSFRAAESSRAEDVVGREITLRGVWQADGGNRLNFLVERKEGKPDRLVFQGGWEFRPGREIVYRLEGSERLLRFQGAWDLGEDRRLAYVLDGGSGSSFRFRGAFQTPTVLAKEGRLRYQIGAEAAGKRRLQTVTLFGKWKVSDRWGVSFEMPIRQGRSRSLDFGASYRFARAGTILAELRTREGKPLGVEVTFTRAFQKNAGEAFLRLRRSVEESAVEGGLRFRW